MGFPLVTEDDFNRENSHLRQADGHYYSASGDGDRVFRLFPSLPAELRLDIWKQAVKNLPIPKVQEFDFDLAYDPNAAPEGRAGNGLIACFKPKHNRQLAGHRGLLMACIDSRKAFLNSGDYHLLPLTYLVVFEDEKTTKEKTEKAESFEYYVKKTNAALINKYGSTERKKTIRIRRVGNTTFRVKKITLPANDVSHEVTEKHFQAHKAFVRVLLPVSFEHTGFLIDKVAETFAYESVHPTPPPPNMAFSRAAGLEFVHSIRKLAFTVDKKAWFGTPLLGLVRHLAGPVSDRSQCPALHFGRAGGAVLRERQGCGAPVLHRRGSDLDQRPHHRGSTVRATVQSARGMACLGPVQAANKPAEAVGSVQSGLQLALGRSHLSEMHL